MENTMIEVITTMNKSAEDILPQMARVYQQEFAKEPWLEVSKCVNSVCSEGIGACPVGEACGRCGQVLVSAYDTNELINGWSDLLDEGKSWLEIVTARNYLHPGYISAQD
jgi:hypothetical protein